MLLGKRLLVFVHSKLNSKVFRLLKTLAFSSQLSALKSRVLDHKRKKYPTHFRFFVPCACRRTDIKVNP